MRPWKEKRMKTRRVYKHTSPRSPTNRWKQRILYMYVYVWLSKRDTRWQSDDPSVRLVMHASVSLHQSLLRISWQWEIPLITESKRRGIIVSDLFTSFDTIYPSAGLSSAFFANVDEQIGDIERDENTQVSPVTQGNRCAQLSIHACGTNDCSSWKKSLEHFLLCVRCSQY